MAFSKTRKVQRIQRGAGWFSSGSNASKKEGIAKIYDVQQKAIVPTEIQEVLTKNGWQRYPNISSCYEQDFEALGNLLNGINTSRPTSKCSGSLIYSAYYDIYDILQAEFVDNKSRCIEFLTFLTNNVKVIRMRITEWEFTISLFESLNNIKVQVPPSSILKNSFAAAIGFDKSAIIHKEFRSLEEKYGNQYEQKIYAFMNLYSGKISKFSDYEKNITSIVDKSDNNALVKFTEIVNKVTEIDKFIKNDPFGNILTKALSSGHEIYTYCLMPAGFLLLPLNEKDFRGLLRLLVAFAIRMRSHISFNGLAYQAPIIELMNSFLSGNKPATDLLPEIKKILIKWLDNENAIYDELVITGIQEEVYKLGKAWSRARGMILYLVEVTDSHESRLDHTKTDIDHINPKNPKTKTLKNHDLCHRLGNFTPL